MSTFHFFKFLNDHITWLDFKIPITKIDSFSMSAAECIDSANILSECVYTHTANLKTKFNKSLEKN